MQNSSRIRQLRDKGFTVRVVHHRIFDLSVVNAKGKRVKVDSVLLPVSKYGKSGTVKANLDKLSVGGISASLSSQGGETVVAVIKGDKTLAAAAVSCSKAKFYNKADQLGKALDKLSAKILEKIS